MGTSRLVEMEIKKREEERRRNGMKGVSSVRYDHNLTLFWMWKWT